MSSVKTDPTLLEEQDDLLMSYLNSDYLSTDNASWPPLDASTPESTSSSEPTHVISPDNSPEYACKDSFELSPKDGQPSWPLSNYTLPDNLHQSACLQPDLLSGFPFFITAAQSRQQQQQQQLLLSTSTTLSSNLVYTTPSNSQVSSPDSMSSYSSVDNDQVKRKRGRKKNDSVTSTNSATADSPVTTPVIAPAPAAPLQGFKSLALIRPAATASLQSPPPPPPPSIPSPVKIEPSSNKNEENTKPLNQNEKSVILDDQKAAAIAKRQERLIKNRAAALLSRKRKREHLTQLEEQKKDLLLENEDLRNKLKSLENEKNNLNTENQELKSQLSLYESKHKVTPMSSMVLMILLFSIAILAFPAKSSRLPLLNTSTTTFQLGRYCSQANDCKTKDKPIENTDEAASLFIETVNGKKLEKRIQKEMKSEETMRLFSDRIVQLHKEKGDGIASKSISLLCPYEENQSCKEETQHFLQIDMQVVRSRLIHGLFKNDSESDLLYKQQQSIKRRRLS